MNGWKEKNKLDYQETILLPEEELQDVRKEDGETKKRKKKKCVYITLGSQSITFH